MPPPPSRSTTTPSRPAAPRRTTACIPSAPRSTPRAPARAITATDTSNASLVGSTSGGIFTVGLYLTAFAATPSGFTATFNKLLNANQLDYYRFAGQTVLPDISMTLGATAVAGSVVVTSTATQTTLTFVNTNPLGALAALPPAGVHGDPGQRHPGHGGRRSSPAMPTAWWPAPPTASASPRSRRRRRP